MEDLGFCDNIAWFNIKLLTIFNLQDNTKFMKGKTYITAVKNICEKERVPISHYVHIGRVLDSHECKLNEDPREEISNLGNWGLIVQEIHYSTKIPLGIIHSKAHPKNFLIGIQELDSPLCRGSVMLFHRGSKRPRLILTQIQQTMQHMQQEDTSLCS